MKWMLQCSHIRGLAIPISQSFCIQRILIHMHNALHIQLLAKIFFKKFNTCILFKRSTPDNRTEASDSLISSWKVLLVFLNYLR